MEVDATIENDGSKPPWSRSIRVKVLRKSVYQTEISHAAEPQPPAGATIDTIESLLPATWLRLVLYRPKCAHRLHSSHGLKSVRLYAVMQCRILRHDSYSWIRGVCPPGNTGQGLERRCKFTIRICRVDPPASKQASHRRLSPGTLCLLTLSLPRPIRVPGSGGLGSPGAKHEERPFDHLFEPIMGHTEAHIRAFMHGRVPSSHLVHRT